MKKTLSLILIVAMLVTAIPFVASAENETVITTQAELAAMTATGSYKLGNDITISGSWELDIPFGGTFDGNGKTIYFADGLQLKGGLFSQLREGATVQNLTIKQLGSATYTPGNHRYESENKDSWGIGVLASVIRGRYWGVSYKPTTIKNVSVLADVVVNTNAYHVGGLVGYARHSVALFEDCSFSGSITVNGSAYDERATGGILGATEHYVYGLGFYNCVNYGEINSCGLTGGIFGGNKITEGRKGITITYDNTALLIDGCMNFGSVTGSVGATGGILGSGTMVDGWNTMILKNVNFGNVAFAGANGYAGGIVGYLTAPGWTVVNCNVNYGSVAAGSGTVGTIMGGSPNIPNDFYANFCDDTTPNTNGVNYEKVALITDPAAALAEINAIYPDVFVVDPASNILILKWADNVFPYQQANNYFMRVSLSLDGHVGVNFGVTADCDIPDGLIFSLEKNGEVVFEKTASACYDEEDGMFICTALLDAEEMTDVNTYTVSVKMGEDVYWTDTAELSVQQYAKAILNSAVFKDWHPLMNAMLQYGAAAQMCFGYQDDNLAADISQGISFDASSLSDATMEGNSSFLSEISGELSFEAGNDLIAKFKPVDANATLSATVKDQNGQIVSDVISETKDGLFVVCIKKLPAEKLGEIYQISVTDGSKTATFNYGALCWVKMILDDQNASENEKNLAKAVGAYAFAAQAATNISMPVFFSDGGRALYSVVYAADASEYLVGTLKNIEQNLASNGVALTVGTKIPAKGNTLTLTRSSSVTGWEISFDADNNITILGDSDLMLANGMMYFTAELLGKVSHGYYMISSNDGASDTATDYVRSGWELALPAYDGGKLATQVYDGGTGMSVDNNAAHGERSYMMCIYGTSEAQFNVYLAKLSNCGYTQVSATTLASPKQYGVFAQENLYRQYRKGMQLVYVYFNEAAGEVRVIEDRASVAETEFEYSFDYDSDTPVEVYMYGMKYNPYGLGNNASNGANNGTLFIIKQADGSVIIVDGGTEVQATAAAIDGLYQFLRQITGTPADQKVRIACWFITHPHEDHQVVVQKMINKYHDQLDLERMMFNFPNAKKTGIEATEFRGSVKTYYPDVMFAKCHAGQSIQLGSIVLDVLMTHEDMVTASTGVSAMTEGNSASTVIRYTMPDGTRFLNLGDYTLEQQAYLIGGTDASNKTITGRLLDDELACDIVEVSHHGYNMVTDTYKATNAAYALWPNASHEKFPPTSDTTHGWKTETSKAIVERLVTYTRVTEENIYYAGRGTAKLTCQGGSITVSVMDSVY